MSEEEIAIGILAHIKLHFGIAFFKYRFALCHASPVINFDDIEKITDIRRPSTDLWKANGEMEVATSTMQEYKLGCDKMFWFMEHISKKYLPAHERESHSSAWQRKKVLVPSRSEGVSKNAGCHQMRLLLQKFAEDNLFKAQQPLPVADNNLDESDGEESQEIFEQPAKKRRMEAPEHGEASSSSSSSSSRPSDGAPNPVSAAEEPVESADILEETIIGCNIGNRLATPTSLEDLETPEHPEAPVAPTIPVATVAPLPPVVPAVPEIPEAPAIPTAPEAPEAVIPSLVFTLPIDVNGANFLATSENAPLLVTVSVNPDNIFSTPLTDAPAAHVTIAEPENSEAPPVAAAAIVPDEAAAHSAPSAASATVPNEVAVHSAPSAASAIVPAEVAAHSSLSTSSAPNNTDPPNDAIYNDVFITPNNNNNNNDIIDVNLPDLFGMSELPDLPDLFDLLGPDNSFFDHL